MIRCLLVILLVASTALGQEGDFKLPKDPKARVLSLDFEGGFTPQRRNPRPYFEILADGTTIVRDVYVAPKMGEISGKVTTKELQALLRFVIDEQKLGAWSDKIVKKEIDDLRASGKMIPDITDAAHTVVRIALPKLKKKASFYALGFVAPRLPEIEMLQRLDRVKNRLHHIAIMLRIGGEKGLAPWLKRINAKLESERPKEAPISSEDLRNVLHGRNETLHLSFSRPLSDKKSKLLYVSVQVEKEKEPIITIQLIDRL